MTRLSIPRRLDITDTLYGRLHPSLQRYRPPKTPQNASRGHATQIVDKLPPETLVALQGLKRRLEDEERGTHIRHTIERAAPLPL